MKFNRLIPAKALLLAVILFNLYASAQEKTSPAELEATKAEALKLVDENKFLQALPLLEKVAPAFPNDAELWAHYGIAVMGNAITIGDGAVRKKELIRGLGILNKARELGTKNVVALNMLDQIPADADFDDQMANGNPEEMKALREGESFFGRGEYDKAFIAYEKAYKLNPKSYEAALFMGDSLYAQKKYGESERWFAKAVEIDPNREQAHRFWGDALLNQKKFKEALDRFAEGMIAEPFSRMSWNSLNRWADASETKVTTVKIAPPGNEDAGDIKIEETELKADDGTIHWKLYNDARKAQIIAGAGKDERHTLANELTAWRKVAEAARRDLKTGKIKYPDPGIVNLVKLDDDGMLEPYILFLRMQRDFGEDFLAYREKNRARLKQFIIGYLLGVKS